jgi:hypothetical protein
VFGPSPLRIASKHHVSWPGHTPGTTAPHLPGSCRCCSCSALQAG